MPTSQKVASPTNRVAFAKGRRQFIGVGMTFALVFASVIGSSRAEEIPEGFVSLFNGKDFQGWKVPEGDNGHWKTVDGVIDCDARSEADGGNNGRSLWSEKSFRDFVLRIDWKIKDEPGLVHRVPFIKPDGTYEKLPNGKTKETELEDYDSGIYLRGSPKAQVNIWRWPVGSGEIWGYRNDPDVSAEVRSACTPLQNADKPKGEWNRFEITMKGDRLSGKLNGIEVIRDAQLPGIPEAGPIALQHHGTWDPRTDSWAFTYGPQRWSGGPSLVQFRNIWIKKL